MYKCFLIFVKTTQMSKVKNMCSLLLMKLKIGYIHWHYIICHEQSFKIIFSKNVNTFIYYIGIEHKSIENREPLE